jgi:hypothetical protein
MNIVKLHLFSWANMKGNNGELVLAPICSIHPSTPVYVSPSVDKKDVVVTCKGGGPDHLLNTCSLEEFEQERAEARRQLDQQAV